MLRSSSVKDQTHRPQTADRIPQTTDGAAGCRLRRRSGRAPFSGAAIAASNALSKKNSPGLAQGVLDPVLHVLFYSWNLWPFRRRPGARSPEDASTIVPWSFPFLGSIGVGHSENCSCPMCFYYFCNSPGQATILHLISFTSKMLGCLSEFLHFWKVSYPFNLQNVMMPQRIP